MADGAEEVAADGRRVHKQIGVAAHIFLLVLPVGAVLSRVGPQGCPRRTYATVEPERLLSGPAMDRTARDWGPGCTAAQRVSAAAAQRTPHENTTVDGCVKNTKAYLGKAVRDAPSPPRGAG